MTKLIDLTGQKFSRWTVISRSGNRGRLTYWNCQCECGNKADVGSSALRDGRSRSCGCLKNEETKERSVTHGMSHSKEYSSWNDMMKRCYNKNASHYNNYGGRGIAVCDRWLKFENFYADMGDRLEGTSIDRIDNNGNYEPGNCKWSTRKEQCNNRRSNRFVTYAGKTLTLSEWSDVSGIPAKAIRKRLSVFNWTVKRALTEPLQHRTK